jgi:hypothetical protein
MPSQGASPPENATPPAVSEDSAASADSAAPKEAAGSHWLAGIWQRTKEHRVVQWTLAYAAFGYTALHGMQMAHLAMAYHALHMQAEAQEELQKLRALGWGDARAVSYADLHSQWGDTRSALDWLATAERTRAAALATLKVTWFLDPIRNEPEFKALERRLNFPP